MSNKNEIVVKSNRLVEASYRLDLAEQRIILFSIVEARKTGKGLNATDFVTIRAADYAEHFGIPVKQAYEQIKQAAETLFKRYVILHDTYSKSGVARKTEVRWLSAASYIDGEGTIQLQFSGLMVPYITRLETEFTRYHLEKVANMTSAYAIRLYELLMQWSSVGQREIELAWLKKTLAMEKSYSAIKDFKKRVLDVAVFQINEHSDLNVKYEQRKTGKTVTHLVFYFQSKQEVNQNTEVPDTLAKKKVPDELDFTNKRIFSALMDRGISRKTAEELAKSYDENHIQAMIAYAESQQKHGKIQNLAAFLVKSIKDEYRDNQAEERDKKAQIRQDQENREKHEEEGKKREGEAKKRAIDEFLESLDSEQSSALQAEFIEASKNDSSIMTWYRKKGMESPLVRGCFRNYVFRTRISKSRST